MVKIQLNTKPGSFSPKHSFFDKVGLPRGSVALDKIASYKIVTRDKYDQERTTSTPPGLLNLTVTDSNGPKMHCTAECKRDTQCKGNTRIQCCCSDQEDGTYLATFKAFSKLDVSADDKYSIEVLGRGDNSQAWVAVPFAEGKSESVRLDVKSKGTESSPCKTSDVTGPSLKDGTVLIGPPREETSVLVTVQGGGSYNNLKARLIPLAGTTEHQISVTQTPFQTKVPLFATGIMLCMA
jgi:hypothetical protein